IPVAHLAPSIIPMAPPAPSVNSVALSAPSAIPPAPPVPVAFGADQKSSRLRRTDHNIPENASARMLADDLKRAAARLKPLKALPTRRTDSLAITAADLRATTLKPVQRLVYEADTN